MLSVTLTDDMVRRRTVWMGLYGAQRILARHQRLADPRRVFALSGRGSAGPENVGPRHGAIIIAYYSSMDQIHFVSGVENAKNTPSITNITSK